MDDHFEAFLNSTYTATVLVAPVGYGKTLALCHWIEERMAITGSNDIILFFSCNALMNVHLGGGNLNSWLISLMGYSNEEHFVTLLENQHKKDGYVFLMIDGIDENLFRYGQFQVLINQLIDIISIYRLNACFKLVLTMRLSTWVNNSYLFKNTLDVCFFGNLSNQNPVSNTPLLSINEINELTINCNLGIQGSLPNNLTQILSYPLYFQIYNKQYKNNYNPKNIDKMSVHKLIFSFMSDKLCAGPYSAEKSFLIKGFVKEMDLMKGIFKVDKCKVIDLIKRYNNAYLELLSIGFFQELNTEYDILYKTNLEFGNAYFCEFSIAKTLLFNNNDLFDEKLVQTINQFLNIEYRLGIIKWHLIYVVETRQYNSLHLVSKIELTANDKLKIIDFLSDLLNNDVLKINDNDALIQYFNHDCDQDFFDFYLGLELINLNYPKALNILLNHKLSTEKQILVYSNLAIISIIALDLNGLEKYINRMSAFSSEDYIGLPINPLSCFKAIYSYFKYGVIKNDCFDDITQFCFNPPIKRSGFRDRPANDVLYFIGVITLKICQNPKKTIRFINAVNKHYRPITESPTAYNILFKVIMINEYIIMRDIEEAAKIYNSIQDTFYRCKNHITPFMESLFNTAKVIVSSSCEQYASILTDIRVINVIVDKLDNKLFKIYVLALHLKDENSNVYSTLYKQILYDYKKMIRQNQLSLCLFLGNQVACIG
ncbi:hypothetical protein SAMN05216490_0130 [Mucilaginibacter mallensis]|uniref:NACHT domain-containing protein n=1 Tax=Mucilaginibacter mallensis TaxID=652787 RepID=A0A1H1MPN0_MUCMA|nr:hypothetical protein [Mucilaginibacter mallensis]SDR88602.1 hypothetical protein SAMN05216490_0130 [Mucilaginibacter mallensis]